MGSMSVTHRFFIGGVLTACKRYWFVTDEVAGDEVEDTAEDEAGKVAKIASDAMWHKEAAILALKLERWDENDRAELCFRALYRSWDADG